MQTELAVLNEGVYIPIYNFEVGFDILETQF